MRTKATLQASVNKDLLDRVKRAAKEQNRSISNLVETLLYQALENKKF